MSITNYLIIYWAVLAIIVNKILLWYVLGKVDTYFRNRAIKRYGGLNE